MKRLLFWFVRDGYNSSLPFEFVLKSKANYWAKITWKGDFWVNLAIQQTAQVKDFVTIDLWFKHKFKKLKCYETPLTIMTCYKSDVICIGNVLFSLWFVRSYCNHGSMYAHYHLSVEIMILVMNKVQLQSQPLRFIISYFFVNPL